MPVSVRSRSPWSTALVVAGLLVVVALVLPVADAHSQKMAIPVEEVQGIVLDHIQTQTAKHGVFWVNDAVAGESLGLRYQQMDEGLFGYLGEDTFFAGAQFRDRSSDLPVHVDVLMQGTDPEELTLLEVVVRQREGEARYHWVQEEDLWERREGPGVTQD